MVRFKFVNLQVQPVKSTGTFIIKNLSINIYIFLSIRLFVKMRLETKNLTEFTHTDMDLSVLTGMVRVILDRKIYKNGTVVGPVRVYLFGVGIS